MLPFETSEKELRRISLLGRLAEAAVIAHSRQEFFELFRKRLAEIVPADTISLFLHDPAAKHFLLISNIEAATTRLGSKPIRLSYETTLFSRFLRTHVPIQRGPHVNSSQFSPQEKKIFGKDIAADMAIPIRSQDEHLLGVLHFARKSSVSFSKGQRSLAMAAAALLANLLEREHLAAESKQFQKKEAWWKNRFEPIFEHLTGACCIVDLDSDAIAMVNERFAQLVGQGKKQLLNSPVTGIFEKSSWHNIKQAIKNSSEDIVLQFRSKPPRGADQIQHPMRFSVTKIADTAHVLVKLADTRSQKQRRDLDFKKWHTLGKLCNRLQKEISQEEFDRTVEASLRLFGQAVDARYVVLARPEKGRIHLTKAVKLNETPDGNPPRAWQAGIAEVPHGELARLPGLRYFANINEAETFKAWRPIAKKLGCVSALAIPLHFHGQPAGLIVFFFGRRKKFSRSEKLFIKSAAMSFALEMGNLQLKQVSAKREGQISAIQKLTQSINANLELEEVIKAAALETRKVLKFDLMDVTLFDSDGDNVRLYSVLSKRLSETLGVKKWRGFGNAPGFGWLCVGEKGETPMHPRIEEIVKSKRNVLLMSSDKYLGTIEISNIELDSYNQEHEAFLSQVAGQLAIAIDNSRLFQRLRSRVKDMASLARASWTVAGDTDMQSMASNIMRNILKALSGAAGRLQLIQRPPGFPESFEVNDFPKLPSLLEKPEVRERLFDKRQYFGMENLAAELPKQSVPGALLACPVILHRKTVGSLEIYFPEPRHFARRQIELMRTFANLIATAIDNEQLRRERAEHVAQLEHINGELERFVYTVSHDLKSPIVSIQGFASILADDYAATLDKDARHYLERIQKNAVAMEHLIKDLLDLSRVKRARNAFELLDTPAIARRALLEFSYQIKQEKIQVTLADDLPRVYGEPTQVMQIFTNLIGNAIKFRNKRRSKPCITIGAHIEAQAKFATFWVKDNGIGIKVKDRERIFNLFERGSAGKSTDGSGLGLSIVKRIVENHKGKIWVESETSKGTTFFWTLPLQPPGRDGNPKSQITNSK